VTTATDVAAQGERTTRIPPIAANLLPDEIVEARRSRKIHRAVFASLAVFLVGLAGWYVFASYQTSVARDDLANAQTEAEVLVRQQHQYADVVTTQAQSRAIQTQLSALLATDVNWSSVVDRIRGAAPRGLSVTGISGGLNGTNAQGTPVTTDPNQVGSLTITGYGPDKATIAAYVDQLAGVPGVSAPYLSNATQAGDGVQFSIKVDIVRAALNTRFAKNGGKGTGS
jgi:Tfp pilus assembly protein PilN